MQRKSNIRSTEFETMIRAEVLNVFCIVNNSVLQVSSNIIDIQNNFDIIPDLNYDAQLLQVLISSVHDFRSSSNNTILRIYVANRLYITFRCMSLPLRVLFPSNIKSETDN